MKHGTLTGYARNNCRCDKCKAAMAAYHRQRRVTHPNGPRKAVPHGTLTAYTNYNCRCDECRAVMSAYQKQYRYQRAEVTHASS